MAEIILRLLGSDSNNVDSFVRGCDIDIVIPTGQPVSGEDDTAICPVTNETIHLSYGQCTKTKALCPNHELMRGHVI